MRRQICILCILLIAAGCAPEDGGPVTDAGTTAESSGTPAETRSTEETRAGSTSSPTETGSTAGDSPQTATSATISAVALTTTSAANGADLAGPGLSGVLEDGRGQPVGDITVMACTSAYCLFGKSESDGRFNFPMEPPVDVALKTHENLSATPRLGAALVPVQLAGTSPVDLGRVYVPDLPEGVPFGPASADPQTLLAGDGLQLTVRRDDLKPGIGDVLVDIAARAIPAEHIPALPALGAEQVVAVYALHPFAATSRSPIAVRAPSNLPAGTRVNFRTISEINGHLSTAVPGTSDGAFVTTDPSEGIEELTWLVISR